MKTEEEQLQHLEEAKRELISKSTWYGTALSGLSIQPIGTHFGNKDRCSTAGIDAEGNLLVNMDFLSTQNTNTSGGILLHEILHALFMHPQHMNSLLTQEDRERYNLAADMTVNPMCFGIPRRCSSMPDIPGIFYGIFPSDYHFSDGYTDWQYYALIPKSDTTGAKSHTWDSNGAEKMRQVIVGKIEQRINKAAGVGDEETGDKDEVDSTIIQRAQINIDKRIDKIRGTVPLGLQHALEVHESASAIKWHQVLLNIAKRLLTGKRKVNMKRPDRRFGWFPGKNRDRTPQLIVAVDTSGSTMLYISAFFEQIDRIREQTNATILVIEADACVGKQYVYTGKYPDSCTGGGGTAFFPTFEYIYDKGLKCDALIYLTDGFGDNPPKAGYIDYPVIWCTTYDDPAEWGRVIKLDLSQMQE